MMTGLQRATVASVRNKTGNITDLSEKQMEEHVTAACNCGCRDTTNEENKSEEQEKSDQILFAFGKSGKVTLPLFLKKPKQFTSLFFNASNRYTLKTGQSLAGYSQKPTVK
jgi:hypothetical protein